MVKILVNLERIQLGKTLGVPHFTLNVLDHLASQGGIETVCHVSPDLIELYRNLQGTCSQVYTTRPTYPRWMQRSSLARLLLPEVYQSTWQSRQASQFRHVARQCQVEYSPHHFQPAVSDLPRVVVCFDLHIFDVPWKYEQHGVMKSRMISNLKDAAAILVPFVRPFRVLPQFVEDISDKLFRTPTPTLLADIPLDPQALAETRQLLTVITDLPVVLYPGVLQQHKNHKKLISALAMLRRAGRDLHLVCPGPDFHPEITFDIKQHAAREGMSDRVTFPGYMSSEEVRALYELCAVAVSPSLAEGGNMIVQEALSFGKPVACANIDAARQQIDLMGADVPLFDPFDLQDIADKIWEAYTEGAEQVARNRDAALRIQGWTWQSVAERCHEVIQWVVDDCPAATKPSQDIP